MEKIKTFLKQATLAAGVVVAFVAIINNWVNRQNTLKPILRNKIEVISDTSSQLKGPFHRKEKQ
jgi:hypothetical protein